MAGVPLSPGDLTGARYRANLKDKENRVAAIGKRRGKEQEKKEEEDERTTTAGAPLARSQEALVGGTARTDP